MCKTSVYQARAQEGKKHASVVSTGRNALLKSWKLFKFFIYLS